MPMPTLRVGGERRCQCSACDEFFNSLGAFEKHRTGSYQNRERRCRTQEEMLALGMELNAAGFWITAPRIDMEEDDHD